MEQRSRAADLRELLRKDLADRLEPEGWVALGTPSTERFRLAVFRRSLSDDFQATVQILLAGRSPDRPPVVVIGVIAGVSYEPLRRLYPLLGDFQFAILIDGDVSDLDEESDYEEDDEDEEEEEDHFELGSAGEVPAVAAQLAKVVIERADAFGEEIDSVEALLTRIGGPSTEYRDVCRAAVLAAAGRYEEAGRALDRLKPSPDEFNRAARRRTARQLRRWIESRGDPALIPAHPPPDARWPADRGSFGEKWRESRARDEAVKRVRANSKGKDRDQLRAMLERELADRGLHESRIRIEATLDHLNDSSAEWLRFAVNGLGRIGRGVFKLLREKQLPDLRAPDWLEPPDRAAYELPRSDRSVDVSLTTDACTWLDEVQAQIPSVLGISTLRAWLCWEPEPREEGSVLAVYLGSQRVGTIDPPYSSGFIAVMDAAGFREELPVVHALLARRSSDPRYVVEVAAPTDNAT